ncbi:hypothetical protein PAXINDRAFT_6496 [Paxillus involutus ATCC 200175]|nr:hypothetical protein PAXINDRAFT_6496 [Paxillus involutus ATCC 200175]
MSANAQRDCKALGNSNPIPDPPDHGDGGDDLDDNPDDNNDNDNNNNNLFRDTPDPNNLLPHPIMALAEAIHGLA